MAAGDSIHVSRQSTLEADSLHALERALVPWRFTRIDQRDDFGWDGIVRIVEPDGDGGGLATPQTCHVQVKAHEAPFDERHVEVFETRHVAQWADRLAPATLLAVWSRSQNRFRWRLARDLARELDVLRPEWRRQDSVSSEFRAEHEDLALTELARRVADDLDQVGGRADFHKARRRVLLADLYMGSTQTSLVMTTRSDAGEHVFRAGPSWRDGDLDPLDVWASGALGAALMVYEEVWAPLASYPTLRVALGAPGLRSLLESGRVVFFATFDTPGFEHIAGQHRGLVTMATPVEPDHIAAWIGRMTDQDGSKELAGAVLRGTKLCRPGLAQQIVRLSQADLRDVRIRELLGMGPAGDGEPAWDGPLVSRVIHLNTVLAVATDEALDVVELEAGLSRVATEKLLGALGFHHAFRTGATLDAVLREAGVPDAWLLVQMLGLDQCVAVAESAACQEFRDWYWEAAASACRDRRDVDLPHAVACGVFGHEEPLRIATQLKLAFVSRVRGTYVVGRSPVGRRNLGFATRGTDGEARLRI